MQNIKNSVKKTISELKDLNPFEIELIIDNEISNACMETYVDSEERIKLKKEIMHEIVGYGKIEQFMNDNSINEIMVNGTDNVFIERNGKLFKTEEQLNEEELENLIHKIAAEINKSISISKPIVDGVLKDGSRVNIVGLPIAINGPTITIRKFANRILTIEDIIKNNTITKDIADFLKYLVINKYNIFVSGGTGSGKTTLLNVLSNFIEENERVITIEDAAELQIKHIKNLVRLQTRDTNISNENKITIKDLVITSLRMRPDRIIVGEVRGNEAFDMLQAMNTGHDGSLSTGHANSSFDMLTRLESMVIQTYDVPLEAIKRQIASALDIIIHVSRTEKGERKIVEIKQIMGYRDNKYLFNDLYAFDKSKNGLIKKGDLIEKNNN